MNTKVGYGQLLTNELIDGGRYRIQALIGTGGMGVVYSAKQVSMNRDVAIKLLQAKLTGDETMLKRFEQEALSISRLRHPNIITIFDYGRTEDDRLFMVMERLNGDSLHSVLQSKRLNSTESLNILNQVAGAVAEAHLQGVVHRDLKPENIHLETVGGEDNFVKVLDFGIAKIVHGDGQSPLNQPVTQAGVVFGTPHYMSPEQVHGHEIDHRSDIYALGVLLYELISGQLPFQGCSNVEAMLAQVSQPFPDLSALQPERQGIVDMSRLIADCTAKDPADRVQSAEAVRKRIEEILPIVAGDLSLPSRNPGGVSGTADTEYVSSEEAANPAPVETPAHDYQFTLTESDPDEAPPPLMTPAPFKGQLNPTGMEDALPSNTGTRSWAVLLSAVAVILAIWALWQRPTETNKDVVTQSRNGSLYPPRTSKTTATLKGTRFRVISEPAGAQIFRGKVQVGVTPEDIVLTAPETQTLRFELDGYQTAERQLTSNGQEAASLTVALNPLSAWLVVKTDPPGAEVVSGGNVLGLTPTELKPMIKDGPLELVLRRTGYHEATEVVQLRASGEAPQEIQIKLDRLVLRKKRSNSARPKTRRASKPKRDARTSPKTPKVEKVKEPESGKTKAEGFDKL